MLKKILHTPFFIKLLHWEYWSFNTVYGPIYIVWILLCIRSRSFFFFNTSNPSIKNGGFLQESKYEIYQLIPPQYHPQTLFFKAGVNEEFFLREVRTSGLQYPLIAKPDIGMRGLSVKKVESDTELLDYARQTKVDFLVQAFIPFENEVGIFYYRIPGEERGHISGIVGKEFLSVTGNGNSTIEELLNENKRFVLQIPALKKMYGEELNKVLTKDESFLMVPFGNHARGAKFIDVTHWADEALTSVIDHVCKQVPQFYFGRMDLRYNTLEELRQGKNFSIVELNGAGSEPTHIYDPRHSIFFAWKEIIRHWILLQRISIINHKKLNIPYMSFAEGRRMIKENSEYVKKIS